VGKPQTSRLTNLTKNAMDSPTKDQDRAALERRIAVVKGEFETLPESHLSHGAAVKQWEQLLAEMSDLEDAIGKDSPTS
jgi:hypothetical protein